MRGLGWRHPHYAQVLEQRPGLDFLEVHSENFFAAGGAAVGVLEQARAHYDLSLHGVGLSLGSAVGVDAWHLDQLARLVQRIDPVRVSDHAAFARGYFQNTLVHAADLLPLPFTDEALQVLCSNVQQVQDRLQRPLAVENLSAYLAWQVDEDSAQWREPDFLAALTQRTGCQLVLDVNNIYVNALNAARTMPTHDPLATCCAWIDALAGVAVAEVHVAGHAHVHDALGDIVIDDHGSRVCAPVWALYRHACTVFGAVPTVVEWDTNIPALEVLLEEVACATHIRAQVLAGDAV